MFGMRYWAGAVLGVAMLAGCSSAPAATGGDQAARDKVFLEMARGYAANVPDANLIDVRENFCKVLDEDPRPGKYVVAVATLMRQDVFKDHAGELAGVFVASGCPEHENLIPGH